MRSQAQASPLIWRMAPAALFYACRPALQFTITVPRISLQGEPSANGDLFCRAPHCPYRAAVWRKLSCRLIPRKCPECRSLPGRGCRAHRSSAGNCALFPGGQRWDRPIPGTLGSGARPRVQPADGWFRMAARRTGHRHRLLGGAVRPLLHVPSRSRTALLFIPARLHGRDARYRPFR